MSENVKKNLLIEPHYLPSFSWMKLIAGYDIIYLDISENYIKASYRNRCIISGPNGLLNLSIPVKKNRNERNKTGTIAIDNSFSWQKNHWMTLTSCYRRSPYFEFFEDMFSPIYLKKYQRLIDIDLDLINLLFKLTEIKSEIRFTDSYIEPGTGGFDDFRDKIYPGTINPLKLNFEKIHTGLQRQV
ncbi:MAG: WbqC family protein [Chitinophagales bacterium]